MQKKLSILTCVLSLLFFNGCKPKTDVGADPEAANKLTPFRTAEGKWGYSKGGKTVIAASFDNVSPFRGGTARIKVGDKYGFIDESGKTIIEPKYAAAGRFSDGLAPARTGEKFGYIDKTGKMAIEAKYSAAGDFLDGFAAVVLDEVTGYIDTKGAFEKGDPPGTVTNEDGLVLETEEGGN